jgi:uncharacterized protein
MTYFAKKQPKFDTTMPATFSPYLKSERYEFIDLLRGFALLGILMVNMPIMNSPFVAQHGELALWENPVNKTAHWIILFFFTGKFYTIFSMLFGIGFYFFLRKADETGKSVLPVFRRRLFWLLIIGILHVVLLWYGDILVFYALFGFIMMLFRNKSNRTLIIWAVVILLIPVTLTILFTLFINLAMSIPEAAAGMQEGFAQAKENMRIMTENALAIYPSGSFAEIISIRLQEYSNVMGGLLFFFPNVLAMFLVGMVLARKRVFENLEASKPFFKKLLFISLPFALIGNFMLAHFGFKSGYTSVDWNTFGFIVGQAIGGPAMSFVYISLLAHCYYNGYFKKLSLMVIKTGRMALTNYIMQSVIATTIFFSYGLGLYGKVNVWQGMLLTVLIYIIQLVWSEYWLNHFRFGPMEWLWRTLTYGKKQKMRD